VCIAVGGGLYAHFIPPGAPLAAAASQTDHLSDRERSLRLESFNALPPLQLSPVPTQEVKSAIDSMHLSGPAQQELLTETTPGAQAQPADATQTPVRLAWITLWDTDVQDGDVVRIQAQGYSRTVTLTKHGATFAIPVPASGIVRVTGIKDGDGGGITVGLASGTARAVFPIMSPGQTLELAVTLD
jgi:hypothetical protein